MTDADGAADAELRRRAGAGDVDAMTVLGKRLLSGPLPQTHEAIPLLNAAAHGTGGEAAAIVALLAAAGAGTPQSWPNALDYLARACALGWAPAQAHLRLLAGAGGEDWKGLRRAVDIDAWLRAPAPRVLSASPYVAAIEGFLPRGVCEALIGLSRGKLERASVYDFKTGAAAVDEARSNSTIDFTLLDSDVILILARARIAAATGTPWEHLEPPSVLHYAVGQEFTPHVDWLDPAISGHAENLSRKGQRVGTFLVYLNEDFEGGETDFPLLDLRFKGRTGDALLFGNIGPTGVGDPRTLHAGRAPTRGEKWLLSQWIRSQPPAADAPAARSASA